MPMPTATPIESSIARRRGWPRERPSEITAAAGAKNGSGWPTIRRASSQAIPAATADWRIASQASRAARSAAGPRRGRVARGPSRGTASGRAYPAVAAEAAGAVEEGRASSLRLAPLRAAGTRCRERRAGGQPERDAGARRGDAGDRDLGQWDADDAGDGADLSAGGGAVAGRPQGDAGAAGLGRALARGDAGGRGRDDADRRLRLRLRLRLACRPGRRRLRMASPAAGRLLVGDRAPTTTAGSNAGPAHPETRTSG